MASSPSLVDRGLQLVGLSEHKVDVDVTLFDHAAVQEESGLERLNVEEEVGRLGPPELRDRLGVSPSDVSGLCCDPGSLSLPVVFGRRRNAVAVVSLSHEVGTLELRQRGLYLSEAGITVDARMQGRRDVLWRSVDALDVLEQADRLSDRLGQGMPDRRPDPVDLAANLAGDVS